MYNKILKFVDLVFKSLGIIIIVLTLTFVVVTIKSCGNAFNAMDKIQNTK